MSLQNTAGLDLAPKAMDSRLPDQIAGPKSFHTNRKLNIWIDAWASNTDVKPASGWPSDCCVGPANIFKPSKMGHLQIRNSAQLSPNNGEFLEGGQRHTRSVVPRRVVTQRLQ